MKKQIKQKSKVIPLSDRVLIRPMEDDSHSRTASGIYIPETSAKEIPQQGQVVAVGAGRFEDGKRIALSVSVGDTVLFSKYGYEEVKIDGVEYFIIKEDNILAILNS